MAVRDEVSVHVSEPWMAQGSCRGMDPEFFFPSDGAGVVAARRICARCRVQEQCLRFALAHRIDHGVWGGASERERRRMLRAGVPRA